MGIRLGKYGAVLAASVMLVLGTAMHDGFAQMPGGGFKGGQGGGHRGQQGARRDAPRADTAPAPAPDPLATFFLELRSLREGLMIRQEQVDAWVAMREALRSYVELVPATGTGTEISSGTPLLALRQRVERSRKLAAALQDVEARVDALLPVLDAHQQTLFQSRLAAAFAAGR